MQKSHVEAARKSAHEFIAVVDRVLEEIHKRDPIKVTYWIMDAKDRRAIKKVAYNLGKMLEGLNG